MHYGSAQPARLNALAYARGSEIHVAPGQEQHLPHEAWHVVQQAQGRVRPTMQLQAGVPANDDTGLEHEADVMGAKALAPAAQLGRGPEADGKHSTSNLIARHPANTIQRVGGGKVTTKDGTLKVIKDVAAGKAAKTTKIEVPLTVTYADDSLDLLDLNVSHERHLLASYTGKLNETKDNQLNTIAAVTEGEFMAGFEDYSTQVADLIGLQGSGYKPDDGANKLDTVAGIRFHSDNAKFGASIHCFPTAGGKAMTLNKDEFKAFKEVTRLLSIYDWSAASSTVAKGTLAWKNPANDNWKAGLLTKGQHVQIESILASADRQIAAAREKKKSDAKAAAAKK